MKVHEAKSKVLPLEHFFELFQSHGLDVHLKNKRKNLQVIQINSANPKETRKHLVNDLAEELGIQFAVPRKTKKDGYWLGIMQDGMDDVYIVELKKGGIYRPGKANEIGLQGFIRSEIESNGLCHLDITDNYGVHVVLDIVDVVDASEEHGKKGSANRSDTIVELKDGRLYGISQKQPDASIVCSAKKMFKTIIYQCGQALRRYAIEHDMERGQYMDVRVTNRDLIDLCWFGTDIAKGNERLAGGAVFIGDFRDMASGEQSIERIIETGDDDFLTSFPIYSKWLIVNNQYTIEFKGVYCKNCKWIIDDVEVPGINAPLPNGKSYYTGEEEPKKKRRRRKKRKVNEDGDEDAQLMEEARQNDMWDIIAQCAENHKMVWLKYETVEDGTVISRKVAPYSYRTRNTKTRGRSTYFYAQDFTPGEDNCIKCFLIENCLDVRESKQSFTPKFPVEIKREIDELERKREREEQQKIDDKERDELKNQDDGIVDDNDDEVQVTDKQEEEPEKETPPPPEKPQGNNKEQVTVDKEPEAKPEPKPTEQKPKENPTPPPKDEPNADNSVTLGDDDEVEKPEDGEVQVTDDDGNVLNDEQQ